MSTDEVSLFRPDLVFFGVEATDRFDLFRQLGVELDRRGLVRDTWYDAICDRERRYPTGLVSPAIQVAIPHTDPEHIVEPYIAIVRPASPVEFEAMAGVGDPVQAELVINLGIQREEGQVQALQDLMNIFMDDDATASILSQTTGEDMIRAIRSHII